MWKIKNRPISGRFFFQGKKLFFINIDYDKRCKHEIGFNNKNICSQFSYIVSHKINFMAFDLHRDHPPAVELKTIIWRFLARKTERIRPIFGSHIKILAWPRFSARKPHQLSSSCEKFNLLLLLYLADFTNFRLRFVISLR